MQPKDKIKELYKSLKSYASVGRALGISRQRVYQVIKDYHNTGINGRKGKYKKLFKTNPLTNWKKCKICLKLEATIVHHKDFNNSNDDISNLVVVCKSCHSILHWGKRGYVV